MLVTLDFSVGGVELQCWWFFTSVLVTLDFSVDDAALQRW